MTQIATDPPVSEAQRRAMFAAREGKSTLGIPKSVGEEFVGKDEDEDKEAEDDGEQRLKLKLKMPNVVQKLAPNPGDPVKKTAQDDKDDVAYELREMELKQAQDSFAFDRASVRRSDADGRLHVEVANISKANVCPYLGSEIPDWEKLGLQKDKVYQLFRDPRELEKAAKTFNNLPLLSEHVPVSAEDHKPDMVVGSTGTDAVFREPFLRNNLVVWAQAAIDAIESETQKELSSAYRYRADMTPGNYNGAEYDGVMRDIVGNHVALVREGRAGSDVIVGDSAILSPAHKEIPMSTKKEKITPSAASIATLKKLAADAKLEDMHGFLDSLDKDEPAQDEETAEEKEKREATEKEAARLEAAKDEETPEEKEKREASEKEAARLEAAKDAEPLKAFLKDKISEDDMKALDALMNGEQPTPVKAKDAEPEKEKTVTQDELGKAVKDAVKVATDAATKTQKDIREAENFVRPWVGNIAMAHDSAEAVYRTALGALGVKDVGKLHPEALKHVLAVQPVPGSKRQSETPLAMDASAIDGFNKRFPGAARIGLA